MLDLILGPDGLVLFGLLLLYIIIAAIFYVKYDLLCLRGLGKSLNRLAAKSSVLMPSGSKNLIEFLLNRVRGSGNQILITAWEDYYRDYTTLLHGEVVPDVTAYFNEDRLITVPCARRLLERIWQLLFYLGIAGALVYLALNLSGLKGEVTVAVVSRSLSFVAFYLAEIFLITIIFRFSDAVVLEKTRRSLWYFQYQMAEWLNPLTEATMISVLVESQQQQGKAFREAVADLGKRLDHFETETLAPVLGKQFQDAIELQLAPVMKQGTEILTELAVAVLDKQENGMKDLARTFTEQVTSLTADRLNAFAAAADKVSLSLTGIVGGMEKILAGMENNRISQETAAQETSAALAEAGRIQSEISQALQASLEAVSQSGSIAEELRGYAVQGLDKADAMARHSLQLMEGNIAQVAALQGGLGELARTMEQNIDTAVSRVAGEFDRVLSDFSGLSSDLEATRQKENAELETARAKQSAELEARLEKLVGGIDQSLAGYSEKLTAESTAAAAVYSSSLQEILASNSQTVDKLSAATAEVSLAGSRVLEQINLETGLLYSDLASRVETVYNSLADRVEISYSTLAGQVETMQQRIGALTGNLEQNSETVISRVAAELDRILHEYAQLSAELDTARVRQSAELETRLEKLVGGIDQSLAGYSEKLAAESTAAAAVYSGSLQEILASNSQTVDKLSAATAEVSLAGSRVLEQINLETGLLYSDLASRVETVYNSLAERVETSYSTLAGQVETMQQRIGALTGNLEQNSEIVISRVAAELDRILHEYAQLSTNLEAARKAQSTELENKVAGIISVLDQTLAEHGERLKANSLVAAEEFHSSLEEVLSSNAQTAAQLAEASAEVSLVGGRILEQTNHRAAQLYSDLAGRMDKSIDALGENLAAGMRTAMANSIEIVEKLTTETEAMKEMYDSYFTRIGEQSTKTLDEMDFNMEKIFANFSAQTELIIGRLTDSSGSALDFFDKGIKDLVGYMDEHSRNIGLYAKEINLDVADLSTNLRESVREFSNQIDEGISRTFEDFDKGLGEVTLRLANVLESIRESVEALQKAVAK